MKHILTACLLLIFCSCNNQSTDKQTVTEPVTADKSSLENLVLEKAKPAYTKAYTEISEIKANLKMAEDGLIEKEQAVKLYNNTVGVTMGKLTKFSDVKTRIDTAGEAYVQYRWKAAAAKIATEMAAEKKFEIEKNNQK